VDIIDEAKGDSWKLSKCGVVANRKTINEELINTTRAEIKYDYSIIILL